MAKDLTVGDKAPAFSLKNQDGEMVALRDLKGKRVVLYFYPKDDTPGCTKEACGFRDSMSRIARSGGVVMGISLDGPESHRKFISKYELPFPLLCDEDATVSKQYGVYKLKNMYGKQYWGIERSTFVIDRAGRIFAVFRRVKPDEHVTILREALLEAAHL